MTNTQNTRALRRLSRDPLRYTPEWRYRRARRKDRALGLSLILAAVALAAAMIWK